MTKKKQIKPVFLIISGCGLFLVPAISVFLLFQQDVTQVGLFNKSLIAGAIVTGIYLPILLRLYLLSDTYTGIPLEELELNEEDLKDAVANWVYSRHHKQLEGRIRFIGDEKNAIKCRITVRIE